MGILGVTGGIGLRRYPCSRLTGLFLPFFFFLILPHCWLSQDYWISRGNNSDDIPQSSADKYYIHVNSMTIHHMELGNTSVS